jgi:2-polyprenyl-6-methoxyphenol hydroxylase-like FAD-dependent oxidoreductase
MSNPPSSDTGVLIVGAGPVGLTLACELRRRGIACRLIDKYAEFPITSRALGIQARTLEVFDDLGVVDPIIAQGRPSTGLRLCRASEPWRASSSASTAGRGRTSPIGDSGPKPGEGRGGAAQQVRRLG